MKKREKIIAHLKKKRSRFLNSYSNLHPRFGCIPDARQCGHLHFSRSEEQPESVPVFRSGDVKTLKIKQTTPAKECKYQQTRYHRDNEIMCT